MSGARGRVLRRLAAGASLAVLLGACAGIKPAPVLPIDPIYEPDTTPQPSDAPLIESTPTPSVAPASGSATEGRGSAPSPSPESTPGSSGAATGPDRGAETPATGASPAGPAPQSAIPQQASASGAGAANAPERVALAPANVPSPFTGSEGASPAAPGAATAASAPTETAEDAQLVRLLSDLERYGSYNGDELKRELASANAALARQRTDANRIRVGVLYSLARTSAQEDQRALQMFEAVAKDAPAGSPMRHLAVILQTQVLERQRAVKYEQQKGDAAVQKLEALRAMEQSLFRDRVRGGGGGGGGGGGSGR
jgi:hypothetical protein